MAVGVQCFKILTPAEDIVTESSLRAFRCLSELVSTCFHFFVRFFLMPWIPTGVG